ncbi:hypothetical protein [Kiloniella antarctica]|uniref:DUF3311 domain-containing protein n=1 Tax=Kiloniella antarctica TaxID=1550907 RepID=A0ABW5BJN6_9PROT
MSRPGEKGERSIALFLLALFLFSPLVLSIFNRGELFFGLPSLVAYLFFAWGGIIAAIAWSAWKGRERHGLSDQERGAEIMPYPVDDVLNPKEDSREKFAEDHSDSTGEDPNAR